MEISGEGVGKLALVRQSSGRKRQENDAVWVARLRLAERLLIGAASERPELLTDENWAGAMAHVFALLKKGKR